MPVTLKKYSLYERLIVYCLIYLTIKKKYSNDKTIEIAFNILKDWCEGKINMWNARKYCWTILKRAREIKKERKKQIDYLVELKEKYKN